MTTPQSTTRSTTTTTTLSSPGKRPQLQETQRKKLADLSVGIATGSLGANTIHTLEDKFEAIRQAGFGNVELRFGEYVAWVRGRRPDLPPSTCPEGWGDEDEPDPSDDIIWSALEDDTEDLKVLARDHGLKLLMLQPLNNFDGWPEGHERAEWSRRKAERWLGLCSRLGVEFLQVGSNNAVEATGGDDKYAEDMRWLAGIGAKQSPPVKIAYESWSHSPNVSSWEHTWKLVQKADHPNLGLCLDVAQFCQSKDYGWDVTTGSTWSEETYQGMLCRLRDLPAHKIFYMEISDMLTPAPPLGTPLGKGSVADEWYAKEENRGKGAKLAWILTARPLPLVGRHAGKMGPRGQDMGARVLESVGAILDTGFAGPVILEFFEMIRMEEPDREIPFEYAKAAAESLRLMKEAQALDGE